MSGPEHLDNDENDPIEVMEEGSSPENETVRKKHSTNTSALNNDWSHDMLSLSTQYADYPLVQSMIKYESIRKVASQKDGSYQMKAVKSTDSYLRTIMTFEGRALDRIAFPWALVTIHAAVYTVIAELNPKYRGDNRNVQAWQFFFSIVVNASLSFLLVFRLNRAAARFWQARAYWGDVVAKGRTLVSGLLIHGSHNPRHRDQAIRWIAAFAIAGMHHLRSLKVIPPELLAGILHQHDIEQLEKAGHLPIYAADRVRSHLKQIFIVTRDTPIGLAHAWSLELSQLENSLNVMQDAVGAMERIRGTPLPLVYVSHMRTFLLLFLIALPYVWEGLWHWATIPVIAVASFALLGLDGAAQEVEVPFQKNRSNHLNMDAYCLLFLGNIQQQIRDAADREIAREYSE